MLIELRIVFDRRHGYELTSYMRLSPELNNDLLTLHATARRSDGCLVLININ